MADSRLNFISAIMMPYSGLTALKFPLKGDAQCGPIIFPQEYLLAESKHRRATVVVLAAATLLLERGVTPWDVAIQLGHTDGGQLVMELYGHPSEAGARARVLAAWDAQTGPTQSRQHRPEARDSLPVASWFYGRRVGA